MGLITMSPPYEERQDRVPCHPSSSHPTPPSAPSSSGEGPLPSCSLPSSSSPSLSLSSSPCPLSSRSRPNMSRCSFIGGWSVTLTLLVIMMSMSTVIGGVVWQDNLIPKIRISQLNEADVQRFRGNTSHPDYFKLFEQDGEYLLVGARNIIYNISLSTLEENKRLEWTSLDEDVRLCRLKGKSENDCHNYIRVLAKKSDDVILVCGTNSFKPKCREFIQSGSNFETIRETPGEGLCPYDPHHNSTAVFAEDNLYVATVAQFSGADPLIYRSPLRTEQFNPKHLNAPNFVNSMHHDDHVYFFFRETAVEYINCGKTVYPRVARVCTKDKGGPHKFKNQWTSFVKARLNCSIPGDFPFYFNEIQSTSKVVKGVYNGRQNQIVYGVFTTPTNSLGSSAVCAFSMDDIKTAFEGQFKGQSDQNSNWIPVSNSKVPDPRPGQCSNDSTTLPEITLNFIKDHTLMDASVPSIWGQPLVIQSSFKFRMTQIAVDPQIETVSGKTFDVLFIGTDDGRILKVINSAASVPASHHNHNKVVPVIIEEVAVFSNRSPVTNLLVYHTFYEAKLLVVSSNEIQAIPLHKCQSRASTCGQCVSLQDPYCAWDINRQMCTSSRSRFWARENFVQNIEDGWDNRCPDGRPGGVGVNPKGSSTSKDGAISSGEKSTQPRQPNVINENDMNAEGTTEMKTGFGSGHMMYTAETLAFAVVTSVVSSFVIGFILGYIFSRRCRKEDPNLICHPYSDPTGYTDYQIHHPPDGYPVGGLGSGPNNKPINLVLNVPAKTMGKNANSSADNKPMQNMKKIYL